MPRPSRKGKGPALSELEMLVMDVCWDLGSADTVAIVDAVRERRDLAPTTIRTVLTKIEEKGFIRRVSSDDRRLTFKPRKTRESVGRSTLLGLVTRLFRGEPGLTVRTLLQDERLSDEDLDEIRSMLDSRQTGRGRKP